MSLLENRVSGEWNEWPSAHNSLHACLFQGFQRVALHRKRWLSAHQHTANLSAMAYLQRKIFFVFFIVSCHSRELEKPGSSKRSYMEGKSPLKWSHEGSSRAKESKIMWWWWSSCLEYTEIEGGSIAEAGYDGRLGRASTTEPMRPYAQGKSSKYSIKIYLLRSKKKEDKIYYF